MGIPPRGLRDIRTLSGTASRTSIPYMAYMQITCLEMEKARRGKERASAARLMEKTDARFREIEAEKDRLLRAVGERIRPNQGAAGTVSKPLPRGNTAGFKLRY